MNNSAAMILVVDDEPHNRKLLEALLHPEGYLTTCAASGEEALAAIAVRAPDLILLDIMMPGMDGYQVARILKAQPATVNIPIVMVTAHSDRDARLAGLEAGAEDFLTKPVDRAELWLRVRNLLRLKAYGDFLQDYSSTLEQQVQSRTADLQRFRTAMDATCDAIFLVSRASMRIVEINATACTMLGYDRGELLSICPSRIARVPLAELEAIYDAIIDGPPAGRVEEVQLRRKDGTQIHVELHRQAQRSGGEWIVVGVMRDITERKQTDERLHHLAYYDVLTGLPNRTSFFDTLRKTLATASESDSLVAVLCIDLDHFKNVNDTLGHAVGDELLREFSNRLVQCVRSRDSVARLGGDEFAMILLMQDDQQDAAVVAAKIRDVLRAPFDLQGLHLQGRQVTMTASIGITIHPTDASEPETLSMYADTAMYRAKQAGRDTYRFFTAQMNSDVVARMELEAALRRALENGEFVLHYQPKVRLDDGRIAGVEALLRWQRPGHGLVPPNAFIPLLEETGLIVPVGRWVLATACRQIGQWMRSPVGPLQVSVNVSGRQFVDDDLVVDVMRALRENAIEPGLLDLELTESSLMANTGRAIASLLELKALGVHISIDDFGTGYSSLAYLRRFAIDILKIDISFIRDIPGDADATAIVLAIIRMAQILKLGTVAEGVETAEQMDYLRHHGCDFIQGYFFSRPLPLGDLERLLLEKKCLPALRQEAQVQSA